MASKISTYSMLLLVSVLSLFAMKCVANHHFSIPSSCVGHPGLLKCARDYESARKAAALAKTNITGSTLSVVLDSINVAKGAGISILHFLSTMHADLITDYATVESKIKLNSTVNNAVHELVNASTVILNKTKLSLAELNNVKKSLKIASEIAAKLSPGIDFKGTNKLLGHLIKQFIILTNLTLKVTKTIKANCKSSF